MKTVPAPLVATPWEKSEPEPNVVVALPSVGISIALSKKDVDANTLPWLASGGGWVLPPPAGPGMGGGAPPPPTPAIGWEPGPIKMWPAPSPGGLLGQNPASRRGGAPPPAGTIHSEPRRQHQ